MESKAISLGDYLQRADWKKEKHVPIIEVAGQPQRGKPFEVRLSVGKEVPHPHTTGHHIRFIKLFFQPDGEQFTIHMGTFNFEAHGESVQGPDEGSAKCEPNVTANITLEKPGTLLALSYCNIHGLWENAQAIEPAE